MGSTDRFAFTTINQGDDPTAESYKFSDADRRLMDRLLWIGAELHEHDGASASDHTPVGGPTLTLHTSGGYIPAGQRIYYKYSLVDARGMETAGSPGSFIDTPAQVFDPLAPALGYTTGTGTLAPGQYFYVLSAYTTANTLETKALNAAHVTLNVGAATSSVDLTMPSLPSGATGFNIYRRGPGSPRFYYLASTTGSSYTDDGSAVPLATRTLPISNTTNNENAVTISFPGATPTVPTGFTWRIYRTFSAIDWNNSLMHDVVETAAGIVVAHYDDLGESTSPGFPPEVGQSVGSPPKIDLTDMANVQGVLPPGVNVVPHVVTFEVPGSLAVQTGTVPWYCDFDFADIIEVRAYLGVGSTPAAQDVIVDVNKYFASMATPGWVSIFTENPAHMPHVPTGSTVGDPMVPDITTLVKGDMLSMDIDQAGGGATHTDHNLTVHVLMLVQAGSTTTTLVFP